MQPVHDVANTRCFFGEVFVHDIQQKVLHKYLVFSRYMNTDLC